MRNTLVLQEVSKAEGLEVTQEDLDAEINKLIAGRPNPEQMKSLYESEYFRGMLENELHDRKLMEMVIALGTEGKGAISGPGADLLAADEAPPEPEDEIEASFVEVVEDSEVVVDDAAESEMESEEAAVVIEDEDEESESEDADTVVAVAEEVAAESADVDSEPVAAVAEEDEAEAPEAEPADEDTDEEESK